MTLSAPAPAPSRRRHWWLALAIAAGIAAFVAMNVHLVYVAATSQPECVEHSKAPGEAGSYRAAKSAC